MLGKGMVFHGDLPWLKVEKTSPKKTRSKFRFNSHVHPVIHQGSCFIHTSTFSTKSPLLQGTCYSHADWYPGNIGGISVPWKLEPQRSFWKKWSKKNHFPGGNQKGTKMICKVPTSDFDWLKLWYFINLCRCSWNKGISIPQLHFGGPRLCEVPIIWPGMGHRRCFKSSTDLEKFSNSTH